MPINIPYKPADAPLGTTPGSLITSTNSTKPKDKPLTSSGKVQQGEWQESIMAPGKWNFVPTPPSVNTQTVGNKTFETTDGDASLKSLTQQINTDTSNVADNAGFASRDEDGNLITDQTVDVKSYKGSKMAFAGYTQDSDKKLFNAQTSKQNQLSNDGKTSGFLIPWDRHGRFRMAYTNTQSIGNKMPFGAEWVGSPAMANPLALIRFEQIAGKTHHTKILNQRGSYDFRNKKTKPALKAGSASEAKVGVRTNGGTKSISKADLQKTYGDIGYTGSGDAQVLTDTNGSMFIEIVDETKILWKPSLAVTIKSTSARTISANDPEGKTITSDQSYTDSKQLNIDDSPTEETTEVAADENPPQDDTAVTAEDKMTDLGSSANTMTILKPGWMTNPNQPAYWLFKAGWKKCGNNLIHPSFNCVNNKPAIPASENVKENEKQKAAAIKGAQKDFTDADAQSRRGWVKNQLKKKYYLSDPAGAADANSKILEPTTTNLCDSENWTGQQQFSYKWTDFMYSTYWNWIPNNHLVTLRRFPMPVGDNASVPDQDSTHNYMMPVAQAVTWLGDATGNKASELMTFTGAMGWKTVNAEVHSVDGNEQGAMDGSPFQGFAKFLGMVNFMSGGGKQFGAASGWDEQRAKFDPYADGQYYNKVYGPVNSIRSTKARDDTGLTFTHSIKLNFHYSLREYGGINPKAALLDIMANLLSLTYNNADFWGGANRYFPNKPAYPFLGDKEGFKKWYAGDVTGFMQSVGNQLAQTAKGVFDMLQDLFSNPVAAVKKLLTTGGKLYMAEKQRGNRPALVAFKALLSGAAVGEWHLMVGNPFNPVLMIGNLICTGIDFSFSDKWGPDDFPEEMTATISLEHGKPRDKGDIESMFNRGGGRLHYAYFGENEAWNSASSTENSNIQKGGGLVSQVQAGKESKQNVVDGTVSTAKSLGSSVSSDAVKLAHKVGYN